MSIPKTNLNPPARFLRASHAILTSRDLAKIREFYTEVLGLVVSDEDRDMLYLRGLEERTHHSLVIRATGDEPACGRVGLRVHDEDELERAKHAFEQHGQPCRWADQPFQGRTLHTVDAVGTPLEIVATMAHQPRRDMQVQLHKGGACRRFDHYQITVPDVQKAAVFYASLGFRIADYATLEDEPVGVFLHVKTPPTTSSSSSATDLRDPDGHCVELLLPPIIYMDGDDPPTTFDVGSVNSPQVAWGLPPRRSWLANRSRFLDCEVTYPDRSGDGMTLEDYLGLTGRPATSTGA